MINDMVSQKPKNNQILFVLLAIAFVVVLVLVLKKDKQQTISEEQKASILTELNEQAQKAPPVTPKTKEDIIKNMNGGSALTAEQKAEIVRQSQ